MRLGFKLRTRMLGARLWPERMAPSAETVHSRGRPGALSVFRSPRALVASLSETLAAEQERWFPWAVAAFGGGIAAYFGLSTEPSLFVAGGVVLASAVFGSIVHISTNTLIRFACALMGLYRPAYYVEEKRPEYGPTDPAWATWKAELDAVRNDLDIIVLKNRYGPTGSV